MILYLHDWKAATKPRICQAHEVIAVLEMALTSTFKRWLAGRARFSRHAHINIGTANPDQTPSFHLFLKAREV